MDHPITVDMNPRFILLAVALSLACTRGGTPVTTSPASSRSVATVERTRQLLTALAHDSMEGRRVASVGEARAARFIAARFREAGLEPAGDSGRFFQHLPMAFRTTRSSQPNGQVRERTGPTMLASFADLDTVPVDRRLTSVNVIGILRGSDTALASEVVVVGAHFDHIGIRPAESGDSIANGADDDASGTVAVIEAARILAAGPRPKRTIVFAAFTGEESGLFGIRWYTQHPVVPLERHVADIQVEMIGRPDTAAGGAGKAWLTGYERSTMGSTLMAAGLPVVALNASGVREVVRDGMNGFLLPAKAPAGAFADALAKGAVPETRKKLGRGAHETAAEFSREQSARRALAFYEETRRATRARRLMNHLSPWAALVKRVGLEWDLLSSRTQTVAAAVFGENDEKVKAS